MYQIKCVKGVCIVMYNMDEKLTIVNNFLKDADSEIERACLFGDIQEELKVGNDSMIRKLIKLMYDGVKVAAEKAVKTVGDGTLPKMSEYISFRGDTYETSLVRVMLSSKGYEDGELKFEKSVVSSENIKESLAEFYKQVFGILVENKLMQENLKSINELFEDFAKKAGLNFSVRITTPIAFNGQKIAKITDEEVVFVADEERVFEMDDILVLYEPTEFITEEQIEAAKEAEITLFAKAQTTPQFVAIKEPIIAYLCDMSSLTKPITFIKKAYNRNVEKIRNTKGQVFAYYMKDGVFSVLDVMSGEQPAINVILHPFDVNTLENVDVDINEKVQEMWK